MPNHITNILRMSPEVADGLIRRPSGAEIAQHDQHEAEMAANYLKRTGKKWPFKESLPKYFVDFELVVPSPPNKEVGNCSGQHPEGVVCWYSWNVENWGTKWPAYGPEVQPIEGDRVEVRFDTAWSHPAPVVEALSKKFPGEIIEVEWADEDIGSNVGRYSIESGMVQRADLPEDGSEEALELACRIKYGKTYEEVRTEEWGGPE